MTKSNQPRRFRNFLPPRYDPDDALMQRYTGHLERQVEQWCDQLDQNVDIQSVLVAAQQCDGIRREDSY